MATPDFPTSVIRQELSGTFRTTIPREHVDSLGLKAGDKLGVVPACCQSDQTGLLFEKDLPSDRAHVVAVKMIGPDGRQAIVNPPRKESAMLGLDGKTASWSLEDNDLLARVNIKADLSLGYLGVFHHATTTKIYQRSNGQYAVNLPSKMARELGLEQSIPLRLRLRCLGESYILFGEVEDVDPDARNTVRVQMEGPSGKQARISVFKSLGDGLQLRGKAVEWFFDKQGRRLLGRLNR